MKHELSHEQARPRIEVEEGGRGEGAVATTTNHALVGQSRAERALRFGMGVDGNCFHIFVSGPSGIGKMDLVEDYVREVARERSVPADTTFVMTTRIVRV